ncbi:MAG: 2-amino-4-hydroxy-6-hydroxymethyldihydropteridine diphosphokinase [Spirochaetota bacterium]
MRVFVGLGSNLGDRREALRRAKELLRESGAAVVKESSIAQTAPVDYADQPDFLNQIVILDTDLSPQDLLSLLLNIENKMGRVRLADKGPRIIDLDLLLYGNRIISENSLTVPHYAICSRPFILAHLVELDADLRDPAGGEKYADILARLNDR